MIKIKNISLSLIFLIITLIFNNGMIVKGNETDIKNFENLNVTEDALNIVSVYDVGIDNFSDVKYIKNKNYFIANPLHFEHDDKYNIKGTCTTIAMQMLMGYHNYYNDRRLIPEEIEDGVKLLDDNYGLLSEHPEISFYTTGNMGRESIGTEDALFETLYELNEFGGIPKIGQAIMFVEGAANEFVAKYAEEINENVSITSGIFNKDEAINDIKKGNPIILGYRYIPNDDRSFHVVVAYGYAKLNGIEGFIFHNGTYSGKVQMWAPASLFGYKIRMTVAHEHKLIDLKENINNVFRKVFCIDCGYVGIDELYDFDEDLKQINKIKYIDNNYLKIPLKINSVEILRIGDNAFENCTSLEEIELPNGLQYIGQSAFKGCTNLEMVNIPESVNSVGSYAFENCLNLDTIRMSRKHHGITEIGIGTFNINNQNLKIYVSSNLILDYINDLNWSEYRDLIKTDINIPQYDINCRTDIEITKELKSGYNNIYQLDVDCGKTYVLDVLSELPLNTSIYDSNMCLMDLNFNFFNDYKEGLLETYLSKGTYYIKINSGNSDINDEVQLNIKPKWITNSESVDIGGNNILTHFHKEGNWKTTNLCFNNQIGLGFYKFKLTAIKIDGTEVMYDASSIIIKDADNLEVIKRYNSNNFNILAENSEDINNMCIFLDRTGYYYIDITLKNEEYQSVILSISESAVKEIDVIGRYNQIFTEELMSTYAIGDTALKFTINQPSSYEIVIDPVSTSMEDVTVVLFRLVYDKNIGEYYIDEKIASLLPLKDRLLSLEAGNYYICCFNKKTNQKLTISINRLINSLGITEQVLICDIDESLPYGTEVRHNGGVLGENTITVGFTRHLHFKNIDGVPSLSRYDYDYSYGGKTKSEIIDVSEFGTIYAKKPGTEIVTATYKENRAVIFTIEIIVVSNEIMENMVIESSRTYSLSSTIDIKNGKYCLELTEYNSPYPWIQYYYWEISTEDDIIVTIDQFGRITANGPGVVVLEGIYSKNNKVTLCITIEITE